MNKYEGGGSSSGRSRRVWEKKAEETEETAGYMGQPRQTGTGPRNHNKNTCQWQAWSGLVPASYRLGLSRLLQNGPSEKHMQTVLPRVYVCVCVFFLMCVCVCVEGKNVDKLLAAATFPCRCHSARCQFTFSSSFHCPRSRCVVLLFFSLCSTGNLPPKMTTTASRPAPLWRG